MQQAKQEALKDIKADLMKSGRCFIAFLKNLNPIMDSIVNLYSEVQNKLSNNS